MYTYNSLNQLVGESSPSGTWSYQYDALGNLIATTENGQTTENLVDPASLGNLWGSSGVPEPKSPVTRTGSGW